MTSQERILNTVKGNKVDRIPICAPCPWGRHINPSGIPLGPQVAYLLMDGISVLDEWMTQDVNYLEVIKAAEKKGDKIETYGFPEFDRRFLLISPEFVKIAKTEKKGDSLLIKYQVRTPKGNLEYICEKRRNISTVWDRKPLLDDKEDVEKLLSVPSTFPKADLEDFFKYKRRIEQKGGLMCIFVSTPLVCVSQLFRFEKFLMWCAVEKATIRRLMETVFERIFERLEYFLQGGVGPVFRFGGSEQATPPMMSPALYDEFVVKYDHRLFDLVHRYDSLVAVHCHGKVKDILDKLVNMGVDFLDPVEAAPGGDIEMGQAKKKVRGKITLMGNIQFADMQLCTPREIDGKVRAAVCSGGREKFILSTTEGPVSPLTGRMRDNYLQLIESGHKYGSFQ